MTDRVDLTGYHLTFDAEMTSSADAAQFANAYSNGDRTIAPNGEAETYLDYNPAMAGNPYSFTGGALSITAAPVSSGSLSYTSGMLSTANSFTQNEGYFEIRAEVPGDKGFWSAFWLLSSNYKEIDIMEQPNNNGSTKYYNSIKTSFEESKFQETGDNLSAGYHSYGFMWTDTSVQFTFDGQYVGYATATPADLSGLKMYILANLAVGGYGSWPGQPVQGTSAQYKIDYIRAFSNDPNVAGVAQQTVSSPDGVDTTPNLLPTLPTVGSGAHQLVLLFNEDAYRGDAQFTVSIDGKQQGGVFSTSASHAYLQTQALTIQGDFTGGSHTVSVQFINDLYDGAPDKDRNLYLTQASLDGTVIRNSALALMANGTKSIDFVSPGATVSYPVSVTLGSGPDLLALQVSQDAYLGNAQFTVSVDGVQVGGVQTTTALHADGASQAFNVLGSFAVGTHAVTVNFLNDAYGGSPSLDRNLYVNSAAINNVAIPSSSLIEQANGPQSFTFQKTTDSLTVSVSEDAYQGDAQYRILVDGNYVGNTYTATASHAAGLINQQTVTGNWGKGAHTIGIQFLNDAYGGSPSLDRNLYINGVSYDGVQTPMATIAQGNNGVASVLVPSLSNVLTLHLAEDAYQGDAQFAVTVDGFAAIPASSVTASHTAGASQAFSFLTALSAGSHDIGVTFLNDLYGGNPQADRNLYVAGADLNGTALSANIWTQSLLANGTAHFNLLVSS